MEYQLNTNIKLMLIKCRTKQFVIYHICAISAFNLMPLVDMQSALCLMLVLLLFWMSFLGPLCATQTGIFIPLIKWNTSATFNSIEAGNK